MALSEADERRVESEVARMAGELRNRPSQEKEDRIGVEIGVLPEEERAFVPTALLRLIAAERDGHDLPEPAAPPPQTKRWVNPFRFKRAYDEARVAGSDAPGEEA
jgi:hypothetical protein